MVFANTSQQNKTSNVIWDSLSAQVSKVEETHMVNKLQNIIQNGIQLFFISKNRRQWQKELQKFLGIYLHLTSEWRNETFLRL